MTATRTLSPTVTGALRSVIGLIVVAVLKISFTISFVSLIYAGAFAQHLNQGLALALCGVAIMPVVAALISSKKGIVCAPQDIPALLVSGVVVSWATNAPTSSSESLFPTIAALCALSTVFTGLVLTAVGTFKLGFLARFIPYSVIGGFLASTGVLLFLGALSMMVRAPVSIWTLPELANEATLRLIAPWIVFSLLATWAMRRFGGFALPILLVGAACVFFMALAATGTSLEAASLNGLMLGPFPSGGMTSGFSADVLASIDWGLILGAVPSLISIAALATLGLLLNVSALEVEQGDDFNFEQELKAGGIANLLAGFAGGLTGYHFLSSSIFAHKMGLRHISVGLSISAAALIILWFGVGMIAFFPMGLLASIIAVLGLDLIVEWLWSQPRRLPRKDGFIIVGIVSTAVTVGFLSSLALGFGLAVFFFILSYSRVGVIRFKTSGDLRRSHIERSIDDQLKLSEAGKAWEIFELSGYLFFGSANLLFEQLRDEFSRDVPPKTAIFNFSRVSGVDTSTLFAFGRIQKLCTKLGVSVIFSGLSKTVQSELKGSPLLDDVEVFDTLDDALISIEDSVLEPHHANETWPSSPGLIAPLSQKYPGVDFDLFTSTITLNEGDILVAEGDMSKGLFELNEGELIAEVKHDDVAASILARFQPGALVGEVATFADVARSATIRATKQAKVTLIKPENIPKTRDGFALAADVNKHVASNLALRLSRMNGLYRENML